MIIFETERLLVRPYTEADKDNFFLLNGNEEVVRYIRPAKTKEECALFLLEVIAYARRERRYGRWAVEKKHAGEFVGSFALIPVPAQEEQMQLGYALLPDHWGKGYATELTKAGLQYVFTKTEIDPIYAYTQMPNLPSQKVLLKGGFLHLHNRMEEDKEVACFIMSREAFLKGRQD